MAEWLEWYGFGTEGVPDIEQGEGSVEDIVSHHKDVHKAIRRNATPIKHRAEVNLLAHHKEGFFQVEAMYIDMAPPGGNTTKLDYYVILHNPDPDVGGKTKKEREKYAAISTLSLEYGHRNKRSGTFVPGAWILHDAAGLPHS